MMAGTPAATAPIGISLTCRGGGTPVGSRQRGSEEVREPGGQGRALISGCLWLIPQLRDSAQLLARGVEASESHPSSEETLFPASW